MWSKLIVVLSKRQTRVRAPLRRSGTRSCELIEYAVVQMRSSVYPIDIVEDRTRILLSLTESTT